MTGRAFSASADIQELGQRLNMAHIASGASRPFVWRASGVLDSSKKDALRASCDLANPTILPRSRVALIC